MERLQDGLKKNTFFSGIKLIQVLLHYMDKETLYHFFNGDATLEQEMQVIAWLDENPEHRKELLKERKFFDATLLLADEKSRPNKVISGRFPGWIKEVFKIAAAILITVSIGLYHISKAVSYTHLTLPTIYSV